MKTFTQADLVSFGNYLLSDERKDLVLSNPSFSIEQARENLKVVSDADLANWGEGQEKQREISELVAELQDKLDRGLVSVNYVRTLLGFAELLVRP